MFIKWRVTITQQIAIHAASLLSSRKTDRNGNLRQHLTNTNFSIHFFELIIAKSATFNHITYKTLEH